MSSIYLPTADRSLEQLILREPETYQVDPSLFPRTVFAAAHVVSDPFSEVDPWIDVNIDWDQTLAFREHLWELGFGVAEAMDTAQRGMGLDWNGSKELIEKSINAANAKKALLACGVGTDHLDSVKNHDLEDIIVAYEEQCEYVEKLGGRIIMMASRALVKSAKGPDDYLKVYESILKQVTQPVIIHWLGEVFDPALKGYWGGHHHDQAMEICLKMIDTNQEKIDGIKISLLSKDKEILMRRRLPQKVKMYTGDDFDFPELIQGDEKGFSHALLGIFDAIAGVASAGLTALGRNDFLSYEKILIPTVPLSRHIFQYPTKFYKTGIVFLAYLNGFQDHFTMLGGQESARSTLHLAELIRLANEAGVFNDPELAAHRAKAVFQTRGVIV